MPSNKDNYKSIFRSRPPELQEHEIFFKLPVFYPVVSSLDSRKNVKMIPCLLLDIITISINAIILFPFARFLIDKSSFKNVDQRVQNSLFIFACTNSVMDPIVYGFFNLRKNKARTNNQRMPVSEGRFIFLFTFSPPHFVVYF